MILSEFSNDINVAVIGASGGIGNAFVDHLLSEEKVSKIYAFSRSAIGASDKKIQHIKMDITDQNSMIRAAQELDENLKFNLIITATGILHDQEGLMPEKSLRDIDQKNFEKIFAVNTLGPAYIMQNFVPLLDRQNKSVMAFLSARVGSISDNQLGGWYAYRASKAALNMLIRTSAIEVARKYKQASIIGLHPGTVETKLSDPFQGNVSPEKLFSPQYSTESMLKVVNQIKPDDTGKVFDFAGKEIPA